MNSLYVLNCLTETIERTTPCFCKKTRKGCSLVHPIISPGEFKSERVSLSRACKESESFPGLLGMFPYYPMMQIQFPLIATPMLCPDIRWKSSVMGGAHYVQPNLLLSPSLGFSSAWVNHETNAFSHLNWCHDVDAW